MTGRSRTWAASAHALPVFATLLVFFSLASVGLPALAGFVGEFLVLVGAVDYQPLVGYIAAFTVIFARGLPAVHAPERRLR